MKRNVTMLGLLSLLLTGCGFLISKGPPTGHEQMNSFSCTESTAGPTLDVVWAVLNVLGAAAAAANPDAYEDSDQIVAVGLGWGIVSSFSAASGYKKSKQCRLALQQLADRNARAHQTDSITAAPSLMAVVVSPSDDTLAVGEQIQLVANAHGSSGAVIPNRNFTWSSSNDAIASVSNAGLVRAHAPGAVVIAANTNNVVGTARIVVHAPR
jgi:hypothetical protein